MKRSPFFLIAAALMGLSSIGVSSAVTSHAQHDAKIAFTLSAEERMAFQWIAASRPNQPDPPPWLRPNQRQRRLALRRRFAAGDLRAYA